MKSIKKLISSEFMTNPDEIGAYNTIYPSYEILIIHDEYFEFKRKPGI